MIQFVVPGDPVPQARPRFARRGNFVQTYDEPKSKAYKKLVASYAAKYAPRILLQGPLEVEVLVYKRTLKSFSKPKKLDAETKILRPTTKPDADNFAKGPLDALKGVLWQDDGQVVDLICRKYYSENPRIEVTVKPLSEQQETLF